MYRYKYLSSTLKLYIKKYYCINCVNKFEIKQFLEVLVQNTEFSDMYSFLKALPNNAKKVQGLLFREFSTFLKYLFCNIA